MTEEAEMSRDEGVLCTVVGTKDGPMLGVPTDNPRPGREWRCLGKGLKDDRARDAWEALQRRYRVLRQCVPEGSYVLGESNSPGQPQFELLRVE